jgi:hypothetical protein
VIARAALSPAAVLSLGAGGTPADVFARSFALCQALEAHGLLVFANDAEGKELVQAIKQLEAAHPEVQGVWSCLAVKLGKAGRFIKHQPPSAKRLDNLSAITELFPEWKGSADIAVFANDQADRFGLAANEMVRHDSVSDIDVARAPAAAFSGAFLTCRSDAEGVLAKDAPRDELWDRCFLPLARVSRRLTLLDRYLVQNLADLTASARAADGFMAWFLDHVDREAKDGCELEIIAFRGGPGQQPYDGAAAAQLVSDVLVGDGGRLSRIELVVTQPASYLPHDRHLNSNLGLAVTFPASFNVFEGERVRKEEGVEYTYRSTPEAVDKLQKAEQRFRDDPSAERVEVYQR